MSLSILNWGQPFSGIQGLVKVKFKDKIITMLVDNSFFETEAVALLKHFGESFMEFPKQDVGTTSSLSKETSGGVSARFRKQVYFKNIVYPAVIGEPPTIELVVA